MAGIAFVFLAVIGFFGYQLVSRRKVERDIKEMREESWDDV
jgi:hypothetical protein